MEKEKYEILLAELAEIIQKKNEKIALLDYTVESLTKKIIDAEQAIKNSGKPENIERR